MNLKNLSDDALLQATEAHASEERRSGLQVLWHLREIERRMLYSKLCYGSLFAYVVKHLHYSEGAAMRRIDAMRMLKEMPELEPSIESGELTLTNLSLVKQASENHGKTTLEKRALLEEVKGKSKRECERILAREMPEMISAERERVLTETHTEVRVVLNERQREKLNRLKALLSHKNPNPTYAELIEMLSDLALKKIDPLEQKPKKKSAPKTVVPTEVEKRSENSTVRGEKLPSPPIQVSVLGAERIPTRRSESTPPAEFEERGENQIREITPPRNSLSSSWPFSRAKPISRTFRRELFHTGGGKCIRCGNMHFLEIDHITPRAKGGTNEARNLRVLCRSCNLYEAQRILGQELMRGYLPKTR